MSPQLSPELLKLSRLRESILGRKGLLSCGTDFTVALHENGRLCYTGADRRGQSACLSWVGVTFVTADNHAVVALLDDGTVRTAGLDEDETAFAASLSSVRRIASGGGRVVALLGNGRVVLRDAADGLSDAVSDWQSVADIVCGDGFVAALTTAGRVLMAGGSRMERYTVSTWRGIAALFSDGQGACLYAITEEGTLLSTAALPRAARAWRGLISMAAHGRRLRAVTATGELLSTTRLPTHPGPARACMAVAVAERHAAALCRDGQVLSDGQDDLGQCRTAAFGHLFAHFEALAVSRTARLRAMEAEERAYHTRLAEARRFSPYLLTGERLTACITAYGRVLTSSGYAGSKSWRDVLALAAGNAHLLALHKNGRVSADGNNIAGCCDVADWRNIRALAAGSYHSLGLSWDGHVHFCGLNNKGQGDIAAWDRIRLLRTTDAYTVGVTYDGTWCLAGQPPFAPALTEEFPLHPVDVRPARTHMAALYADGRVVSTLPTADPIAPSAIDPATAAWRHVRAIAVGRGFTVALLYGGTVVAAGRNDEGQCETAAWRHVVAVACGDSYTVGLTSDGRLLAAGRFAHDRTPLADTARFRDVIAFSCSPDHLVALNRAGQIYATGADGDAQCTATAHFSLFRDARHFYGYGKYRPLPEDEADSPPAERMLRTRS